ncbi:MAG: site-specific DNA-methyltransferase [Alphaproteobacteria bacterium]
MSNFDTLVAKLREIFQIDRPDLDFGVYRILNARAGEIEEYLSNRLKARVAEALAAGAAANIEALRAELTKSIKQFEDLGEIPDDKKRVKDLRAALAAASAGASEHENQVFSHLLTFFSRYFDKGDFISQRRYKGDTYAIPYSGEEVVLHWANRDQYYTKSGESFSNFSFKLEDGRAVHFRLVAADTAKDNRKDNDKERRFVLATARTITRTDEDGETFEETIQPVTEEGGALVIRFDYAPQPKGTKQEALVDQAVAAILADDAVQARWLALTTRVPTEKNPQRTLLEKHLTTYTQKNTADYFIHKDLGGFLRRELDFYIKNEVMNLDDVQGAEAFADIERNLRMIQCLRAIALDLITFLASIENFQKKLWLKKKFVVAAHYCVTLDRVPEALYPAIMANPAQWAQWHDLGMRVSAEPGTMADLKAAPFLMVDTALFDAGFRADLLKAIPDLDASLDGLLVHGDNFQSLTLLRERMRERVDCIYIDPPYNTSENSFIYKNEYKNSSWLSLIESRISAAKPIMSDDSIVCCAIDDLELAYLQNTLDAAFGVSARRGNLVVETKPSGRTNDAYLATSHEYVLFYSGSRSTPSIDFFPLTEEQLAAYSEGDGDNTFKWRDFLRTGGYSTPEERPNSFYPIYFNPTSGHASVEAFVGAVEILPTDSEGKHRVWRKTPPSFLVHLNANEIRFKKGRLGEWKVQIIDRVKAGTRPKSVWTGAKFDASSHGTKLIKNLFEVTPDFSFPKSIHAVFDTLYINTASKPEATVMDFFAGSGTTAHAVIALNRSDNGERKYAMVEQGSYFDTVIKPRVQKVVFSSDWKEGKPTAPETGISHAFKVLKIEGYEDTLNNLDLKRSDAQANLLNELGEAARDDYLMRYMLDVEAKGSLLSVSDFWKPFDYTLKVAIDSAGAWEERKVDLVETFNYLIGLTVRHIDIQAKQGFVTVEGWLPTGEKTLILWRDCEKLGYEELTRLCDKLKINPADSEFDVVYINGDHNIPSVVETTEEEGSLVKKLMLSQIEPAFLEAMFNGDDV